MTKTWAAAKARLLAGRLNADESYVAMRIEQGAKPAAIALEMEISHKQMSCYLHRLRVVRRAGKLSIDIPILEPAERSVASRIRDAWHAGFRDEAEIARIASCTVRYVGAVLRDEGLRAPLIKTRQVHLDWTPAREAELLQLLQGGQSFGDIAKAWGDRRLRNALIGKAHRLKRDAPDNASRERRFIAIERELARVMAEEHESLTAPPPPRAFKPFFNEVGVGDPGTRTSRPSREKMARASAPKLKDVRP